MCEPYLFGIVTSWDMRHLGESHRGTAERTGKEGLAAMPAGVMLKPAIAGAGSPAR